MKTERTVDDFRIFTKRHYQAIACVLNKMLWSNDENNIEAVAFCLAQMFERDSSLFDNRLFWVAVFKEPDHD